MELPYLLASAYSYCVKHQQQQDVQYQDHKTEYIQRLSVIETKVESNHSILLKLEEKLDKE